MKIKETAQGLPEYALLAYLIYGLSILIAVLSGISFDEAWALVLSWLGLG